MVERCASRIKPELRGAPPLRQVTAEGRHASACRRFNRMTVRPAHFGFQDEFQDEF
jgi:hypothetical protein